jgi:predicted nucleic acid-binding protein
MSVLVDTSVWIDHLHAGIPGLAAILEQDEVVVHPWVLGELACGSLKRRDAILSDLASLPSAPEAASSECLTLLSQRSLHGKGLSWVDVQLLASCLLGGHRLWTRDKNLLLTASKLGVGHA